MLNEIIGEYAFVAKLDVTDVEASVTWYKGKLDFEVDERYLQDPKWRQMTFGINGVSVGLWQSQSPASSGGAVATFVVRSIDAARAELISRGVAVGPILNVGEGVQLAFFADPDGNALGLRQNSTQQPQP